MDRPLMTLEVDLLLGVNVPDRDGPIKETDRHQAAVRRERNTISHAPGSSMACSRHPTPLVRVLCRAGRNTLSAAISPRDQHPQMRIHSRFAKRYSSSRSPGTLPSNRATSSVPAGLAQVVYRGY